MNRRFFFALLTLGSTLAALVHCGSDDAPVTANEPPTEAGATVDADPSTQDAGEGCPATVPVEGTPCPKPTLQCEYGAFDFADCNATATCGSKVWSIAPPPTDVCAPNNTMCPTTAAEIQTGQACPSSGIECFFAESTCACNTKGSSADGGVTWSCDDAPEGCPKVRPRLGERCTEEGKICDYASCGKAILNIGEQCRGGFWQFLFPHCDGD